MDKKILKKIKGILGGSNCHSALEDRIVYAYDAGPESALPEVIGFPKTADEIAAILKLANRYRFPVVPRGAGSGLTGGSVPVEGGMVIDLQRFNRILEIDTDNLYVVVEPAVTNLDLRQAVEKEGLYYPPDPASLNFSSIGGNIAENAGGMSAVKYGVTKNYVLGLEVVIPNGSIVHTGSKCIKDVVGYDLTTLFVGSEGTLGIITQATLRLLPLPEMKQTLMIAFPTLKKAAEAVSAIIRGRIIPTAVEFLDANCICAIEQQTQLDLPATAEALLLIDIDGESSEITNTAHRTAEICRNCEAASIRIAGSKTESEKMWNARRSLHTALYQYPLVGEDEDIVVPRSRIPDIVGEMQYITRKYGLGFVSFGHAGDGNIHFTLLSENREIDKETVQKARNEILQATVQMEGRISAEHGIGLIKKEKIVWNLDKATLDLMRTVKRSIDPNHIMNPGKIFPSPFPYHARNEKG